MASEIGIDEARRPPLDPPGRVIALVCRGCCCGTSKHADVDHDGHLDLLRSTGVPLLVTPCLGPCRWSNVVVSVESITADQTWFGKVLTDEDIREVASWLAAPDPSCRPEHLVRHPPRPDRQRAAQIASSLTAPLRRRIVPLR